MTISSVDWNKVFELAWRFLVLIVAVGIIIVVSTNWTRWEGGAGWQSTNDAYLQADLTPISAKVAGYVRELPIEDFERVRKGQVLAQLVDDDYRATVAQAEAQVATALAQAQALKAQHELQLANVEAARAVVASTSASSQQNSRDLARQPSCSFSDSILEHRRISRSSRQTRGSMRKSCRSRDWVRRNLSGESQPADHPGLNHR